MIDIETETERRHGVTFVNAAVTNERSTPQLILLEPRVDGQIWSPRPGTATAAEWTDGSWSGVVEPGRTRGLGFATPESPTDRPLEFVSATRVSSDEVSRPERRLATLEGWSPTSAVLAREPRG
ncbi:DUF7857 domain-containing protein [Natronobacterium texcoconense]|uniref:Uncharacterized protein n=1 Tax=Natronobacterium texcoconense TaxID=1095778 RepID=A0A1H0YTZ0_NATTX|nr:hypothetical protein [Natronobacterium texcoconense]SDQ18558.1 hypothetical protein SAMN04489842_0002 [Natronobacterium texcoconense]